MTGVLMLLLIGALLSGALVLSARKSLQTVRRWQTHDECLMAAETAVEKVKSNLYDAFREYHELERSWSDLNWVAANAASFSTSGVLGTLLGVPYEYSNAVVTVTVNPGTVVGVSIESKQLFVTNTATAVWEGETRKIEEVVRYTLHRSSVFDYAYFINNFGWFYGVDCVVNGDIRSNYDVELRSRNLVLNGHSYAAGVNDINNPYQVWSWNTYKNNSYSEFFRPTYHVDQNRSNDDSIFEYGYDDSGTHNYVVELDMPYIGLLDDYKQYAQSKGGMLSNSTLVVTNVYSGPGPSGLTNGFDAGTRYLVGTPADPIVIDGPVVFDGDVIIEGYYTGQGTIYAGRNIHIIGDVIATNPPAWQQPDTASNFENNTLPDNLNADFLGLCAKGAVVLGDYRTLSGSSQYFKPPFTSPYRVSMTDSNIGYVSYTTNGQYYFDGDYTGFSGYRCDDTNPSNGVARNFYEPSVSEDEFDSYNPNRYIDRIDALIYNNHLTIGRFDYDALVNGGIICRDEALFPRGRVYMNWDSRIALDSSFTPFLPLDLGPAETIEWRELNP